MCQKRFIMKISGEALKGDGASLYDTSIIDGICVEIEKVVSAGFQLALVVGAGNLLRGRDAESWGLNRVDADEMGMLFTVANSLMLRNKLNQYGVNATVMTPMLLGGISEVYNRKVAMKYLDEGRVVIFGGGIGNPFVSTDYLAVQRAIEIEADMLLMSKNIDGVYEADPRKDLNAKRYQQLSYKTCIMKKIKACDTSAFLLAEEFGLPMYLYKGKDNREVFDIINGRAIGTVIKQECKDVFYE